MLPESYRILTQSMGYYAIQGHSRSPILVPIKSLYAIPINSNFILHRFGYCLRKVQNRYIWLPLLRLNPPRTRCKLYILHHSGLVLEVILVT